MIVEGTAFSANVPQPLRSDQLFNALFTALELSEEKEFGTNNPLRERDNFAESFGFDPSQDRGTISASIPQLLASDELRSCESVIYSLATKVRCSSNFLKNVADDEELIVELYLRCLSREPTSYEMTQDPVIS